MTQKCLMFKWPDGYCLPAKKSVHHLIRTFCTTLNKEEGEDFT